MKTTTGVAFRERLQEEAPNIKHNEEEIARLQGEIEEATGRLVGPLLEHIGTKREVKGRAIFPPGFLVDYDLMQIEDAGVADEEMEKRHGISYFVRATFPEISPPETYLFNPMQLDFDVRPVMHEGDVVPEES